ncbi:MAG: hypothetical protein J4F33_12175 [Alphaproteobacteria bacterium]|nr:hypothetical protein [Alphaproteobacteria bacterium]
MRKLMPGNVCFRFARGDAEAVAAAFAAAPRRIALELTNNRLAGEAARRRRSPAPCWMRWRRWA